MSIMTGRQLADKAIDVAKNYKTTYMWGVFGSLVTEAIIKQKTAQYPSYYTPSVQATLRAQIGKNVWAFDCVCLIKSLLWGWVGDAAKTYGGAKYVSNDVPDVNADTMMSLCKGVSKDFAHVEIGEALGMKGHIGIYIGDGKAVECTPSWAGGVQITAVGNIGNISGLNTRTWTSHGKLPWVDYSAAPPAPTEKIYTLDCPKLRGQGFTEIRINL